LKKDPHFFQYILKIIPIDYICETNIKTITNLIQNHSKNFIREGDTFKIVINRRKHEKIERNFMIERIASNINNKVDLDNPDKIIRLEVLGNFCGVSFLEKNDIIRVGALKKFL